MSTTDPARTARLIGSAAAACTCGVLTLSFAAPAAADGETPEAPPPAPGNAEQLEHFVQGYDADDFTVRFDADDFVERLGELQPGEEDDEGEEANVIVLETDILFAAMEWELPDAAGSKIGELVEEIPDGAAVDVHGHTDSNPVPEGHDFDNQVLSENRAEAVAEVLGDGRPDLELSVEGFGEDQPAVEEDEEDPSTFAANRRVEIRYD